MQELARVEKRLTLPYSLSLNLLQPEAPGRSCQRRRDSGSCLQVHYRKEEKRSLVRKNCIKEFLFFKCIELPSVIVQITFIMSVVPSHSVL